MNARRRTLHAVAAIVATSAGLLGGCAGESNERRSAVRPALTEARFPYVEGENLEGEAFSLPADFAGPLNVVVIAFERVQQADVDTWLPRLAALSERYPGLRYYELPVLKQFNAFTRYFIDSGMAGGIPDEGARRRTITLYVDKQLFRAALDIEHEREIVVLLVDRRGRVHHRSTGRHTPEAERALLRVLDRAPSRTTNGLKPLIMRRFSWRKFAAESRGSAARPPDGGRRDSVVLRSSVHGFPVAGRYEPACARW